MKIILVVFDSVHVDHSRSEKGRMIAVQTQRMWIASRGSSRMKVHGKDISIGSKYYRPPVKVMCKKISKIPYSAGVNMKIN